jgi:hypothetical protein
MPKTVTLRVMKTETLGEKALVGQRMRENRLGWFWLLHLAQAL